MSNYSFVLQDLFQRILAARTPRQGQVLGVIGGVGCMIMAIPAVVIGAIAASAGKYRTHSTTSVMLLCTSQKEMIILA